MTAEQKVILNILKEIKKICDRHNLKYYLAYGTLLGAVRHNGFIPWDDDVDIVMFRDDYEKFLEIAERELPTYLKLKYPGKNNYPFYFAKVDDIRTTKIEESMTKCKYKSGCWVDIFPIDGRPKNKLARKIYDFKLILKWFICSIKTRNLSSETNTTKIKRYLYKRCKTRNINRLMLKFVRYEKKYSVNNSNFVSLNEAKYIKTIDKKYYEEQAEYVFEGEKFTSLKNYDGYLKLIYGDYMKLPDEEDRQVHTVKYLNLNQGYEKYEFE